MKTFDEALSCCTVSVQACSMEEAASLAAMHSARLEEYKARYCSLAVDVNQSEQFGALVCNLLTQLDTGQLRPQDAIMSAFMCGLITGSEMQKSDVGVEAL